MSIKDYLHLYLGCPVEFIPSGSHIRPKMYGKVHDFPVSGTEYGIRQIEEFEGQPEIVNFAFAPDIKPILRPLSDMTEEEKMNDKNIATIYCCEQAERVKYLLSKHFDLFGLIEAGLAIDKTKIKATP